MLYIFLLPCCSWDTVAMCSSTMYMFHIRACYVWHKVEMCSFTTDLKLLLRLPGVQTPLLQLFLVTWHLHVVAASLFSTPLLRVPRAQDLRSCFGPFFSTNKAVLVQFLCAESAPSRKISCPTSPIESRRGRLMEHSVLLHFYSILMRSKPDSSASRGQWSFEFLRCHPPEFGRCNMFRLLTQGRMSSATPLSSLSHIFIVSSI